MRNYITVISPLIEESEEKVPVVKNWEVKYAIKQIKTGTASVPDNIMTDTLKEAGDVVN